MPKSLIKFIRMFIINYKLRSTRKALNNSQKLIYQIKGPVLTYNQALESKRQSMEREIRGLIQEINSYGKNREKIIYLVLMYFSAIGSHMVTKAEDWLKAWGDGFSKLGHTNIAKSYYEHATEEVGHDKWHKQDVSTLVKKFNQKFRGQLDAEEIISKSKVHCVQSYTELSEKEIPPNKAYLSLAELYETEIMAMNLAPDFIAYCVSEVGFEVLEGLKFLNGHVVADVEHIAENIVQMDSYLKHDQECMPELIQVGEKTINIYLDYFRTSLKLAQETYNKQV